MVSILVPPASGSNQGRWQVRYRGGKEGLAGSAAMRAGKSQSLQTDLMDFLPLAVEGPSCGTAAEERQ